MTSIQKFLGHKKLNTTMIYARAHDQTVEADFYAAMSRVEQRLQVAADYYQTMAVIERRLALPEDRPAPPPSAGQLLALVDSPRAGVLNAAQAETVMQLRASILALAEQ